MNSGFKTATPNTYHGILWMVSTGMLFAAVTGVVRYLGSDMPAVEGAFLRYAIGSLLVLPLIVRNWHGMPEGLMLRLYLARGLIHGGAVMLWFYAMARIPISEVTAIGYMAPVFVTIGAALFLGERIHLRRTGGVVVGFIGALVIIRPGFHEVNLGQLAQLSAAPLFATSFILAKKMTGRENPTMIVGMLSVFCTLVLLPGAFLQWRPPNVHEVAWLGLTAVLATIGHYTLTKAFAAAPITVTQPLAFLQLIWATLIGVLVFSEPLDPFVIFGGVIVITAVTYISHREVQDRKNRKNRETPPPIVSNI